MELPEISEFFEKLWLSLFLTISFDLFATGSSTKLLTNRRKKSFTNFSKLSALINQVAK
jgi:glutaredoxin 2